MRDGLLEIWQLETEEEMASFVQLAAELDDGEAMTCALAIHRGADVATDDRKALRVLGSGQQQQVRVRTTAELIRTWADSCQLDRASLRQVLMGVRERARFAPGRHDALQRWWATVVRGL